MKFSFSSSSSSCFSGFVFSSGSSGGFVSRVWKLFYSGEMGEMRESLGFGMDERGEVGEVGVVVVGKVGVDVREDRADGEGVGGGEFSFWFRSGGGGGGRHDFRSC